MGTRVHLVQLAVLARQVLLELLDLEVTLGSVEEMAVQEVLEQRVIPVPLDSPVLPALKV